MSASPMRAAARPFVTALPPLVLMLGVGGPALAQSVDIADGPLANGVSASTTVKPNLALVIDDSGSMGFPNMPDDGDTNSRERCYAYKGYNTLAYDPGYVYKPPYKPGGAEYSDGVTRYPDASFSAAYYDGYVALSATAFDKTSNESVDLNGRPFTLVHDQGRSINNGQSPLSLSLYYATYGGDAINDANCNNDSMYTAITSAGAITAPSGVDPKTNYANWYSYYRLRGYLLRAAAGEAFSTVGDNFRIGLYFINTGVYSSASNALLAIDDFTSSNRQTWYDTLYSSTCAGSTPLRLALSKMGRMYAGKQSGSGYRDPVQYSCQQNFTILSTDGYWNSEGPLSLTSSSTDSIGDVDGGGTPAIAATSTLTLSSDGWPTHSVPPVHDTIVVSAVSVDGSNLLAASASGATASALASSIASRINAGGSGYTASARCSGRATVTCTVTITAPSGRDLSATPALSFASSTEITISASAFSGYAPASGTTPRPYLDAYGAANTLADTAYYYYTRDLRTSALNNCSNTIAGVSYPDLCTNNVPGSGDDVNSQQHMTTMTVGLGVSGQVYYQPNYKTAGDVAGKNTYTDIVNGTFDWPNPITNSTTARIDDLWHAAVNGRGTYFSATNPASLVAGLRSALAAVTARTGSASAAATSSLQLVDGDNFAYVAKYRTVSWDGDVQQLTLDASGNTAAIAAADTTNWSSAQSRIDAQVASAASGDGRTIKFFSSATTSKLKDFTYTDLNAEGHGADFSNRCSGRLLSQCGTATSFTTAQLDTANDATNLVNYLRGRSSYAVAATDSPALYRSRDHVLGDIVNSTPLYVKKPPFQYGSKDSSYAGFVTDNTNRAATVYVGANDGMLHAINADAKAAGGGTERWAYVPSFVMPEMYRLADAAYGTQHRYYVDGSPLLADVCSDPATFTAGTTNCKQKNDWKSIVVAGLNKGGCGYYALDVTTPASPKGLWEFTDDNMGYTFGDPVVTRTKSGRWVAILSSGYDNVPGGACGKSTGDGKGHIYVLDALTGEKLKDVVTGAGSSAAPINLGKFNAWIDSETENIADAVYAGDLQGGLWRFDIDDNYADSDAVRIATLKNADDTAQAITTRPLLALLHDKYRVAFVGTGRLLATTDLLDSETQSLYAIKLATEDAVSGAATETGALGNPRDDAAFKVRALANQSTASGVLRTVTGLDIDDFNSSEWGAAHGWYFDFDPSGSSPGERVNVEMQLQENVLTVVTNVPESNVCNAGGYSFLYYVNATTGGNLRTVGSSKVIGEKLPQGALVAGISTVETSSGERKTVITFTDGSTATFSQPPSGAASGSLRRTMWREILD